MNYPVPYGYTTQIVMPLPRRNSTAHVVTSWILTVLTGFYLLPWAIAATRNKQGMAPTVLINIFLGWTVIGWIAALVMACTGDRPAAVVITHQPIGYGPSPMPFNGPTTFPDYQPGPYQPAPYQPAHDRPAISPSVGYPAGSYGSGAPGWPTSQPTAPYAPPATGLPAGDLSAGDEPTQVIRDPRSPGAY